MSRTKNNSLGKHHKEYLLYAVLSGIAFLYPFLHVGERVLEGEPFQWSFVIQSWIDIIPFVVLLLVHLFLLLPLLFHKKDSVKYAISVIILLGAFFVYSDYYHQRKKDFWMARISYSQNRISTQSDRDGEMPPPPPPQNNGDIPRKFGMRPYGFRIPGPVIIDTFIALLLLGCSLAIKLMFKHYENTRKMEELEKEHIRQELAQLKAQISPHFFMNSLNNIHGMVEIDPQKAQDMILELSGMMRYVLYESTSAMISLAKEIDFLCNYISLMRVRYTENRVAIQYSFPPKEDSVSIYIPPLIFIIFIENAFKHGVDYQNNSFVHIRMSLEDQELIMQCTNSLHHNEMNEKKGGVGLNNIRKRLDILYAENYTLNICEQENSFHVTLKIPTKNENQMYSSR